MIIKKKSYSIVNPGLLFSLLCLLFLSSVILYSQDQQASKDVYVDDQGVMRWSLNDEEVMGFGVNYSVPFAHAYRSAKRMGVDVKKAIDNDVYHFTRLGFDLYRLHVWDTEISDIYGNLIENAHLDAFDYLLKKLKEKNINYVITPIAFWGNGWPEPDEVTPGFSHHYGKNECLTNEDAIKAQQNYLYQFLNHVNPYTEIAYKDDPNVIAFEVSNEPHHRGEGKAVTEFVKGMVESMRRTGVQKPIFYNMSHAVHFAEDYLKGNIQGGTFQWYPTGLGYQRELPGNMLPNVNDYIIPFDKTIKKYKGAKLVYEFDAADIGRSYIYPAMARSFRTAGIQIATHFAYDPTYMAYANTEYNTHYMNLSYTPQKALSLKICSEIFHKIPMYSQFGTYPDNTSFGEFRVDYKSDLAEYNSEKKFFYTNSTGTMPKSEVNLEEIAGYGNSALIKYSGKGSYFIDKIESGIWRLEVMPDAFWVDNPFGRNSPKKTVGVIQWNEHQMSIKLKDIGTDFNVDAVNDNNSFNPTVTQDSFSIRPGTYIISKKGSPKNWNREDSFKTNRLGDFYAPESTVTGPWLQHKAPAYASQGEDIILNAQFVAPDRPEQLSIQGYLGSHRVNLDMKTVDGFNYTARIPSENLGIGFFNYNMVVKMNEESYLTYPSGKEGRSFEWDYFDRSMYKVAVVPKSTPIFLFDAIEDSDLLVKQWRNTFRLVPTENRGEAEYQMNIEKLFVPNNENLNAKPIYDYSFKHFILDKLRGRRSDLKEKKNIVFYGRALNNKTCKLQIAFVMDDGSSYGGIIEVGVKRERYVLSIESLKPVRTVTLPRPYPVFLPYYLAHDISSKFDVDRIESIQFSVGPGIPEDELNDPHGIAIISLRLE